MIVESGNLSDQAEKLGLITSVLAGLHYDAVGIGPSDRSLGGELLKQASANKLTVLDASAGAGESTLPYIVKNVDGVKVAVISFGADRPGASTNEYTRRKALYSAFKAAREASDVLVVLDQANLVSRDWVERNSKRLGAPDVVVGGTAASQIRGDDAVGQTHLVQTSNLGTHVGVVDIELAHGQPPRYAFQRIELSPAIGNDEAVYKRVQDYQASLHARMISASSKQTGTISAAYYQPLGCRGCHSAQYTDWAASKHARAIRTLVEQERVVPDCIKCHSEEYRITRAINIPRDGIGGVGCITCHKAPMPHWTAPQMVAKVDPKVCIECHTPDRSAAYEEKSYMAKVTHHAGDPSKAAGATAPPPAIK